MEWNATKEIGRLRLSRAMGFTKEDEGMTEMPEVKEFSRNWFIAR